MEWSNLIFLFLIGVVAFLYAAVGHGGASGYLALTSLFGFAPDSMKTTALVLNIFVSLIAFVQYYRSGNFDFKLFLPLALASIPMAFIGGLTPIEDALYKKILGVLLLLPVVRFSGMFNTENDVRKAHSVPIAIGLGLVIGYLSGLIGIGGGIILSPILLWLGWTNMKQTAAISAPFILVNSISGLGGIMLKGIAFDTHMLIWIFIALLGGILGSYYGANRLNNIVLSRILAGVLFIAAGKLLLI